MAGWTDITDGKETGSRNRPLVLSLAAPTEFTIPAVIGDYLPLKVRLNIVLEVAFNSNQPGTRHFSGLPLHFPRIKAVQRDKNVASVDTLQYARSLAERDAQIHRQFDPARE